MSTWTGTTRSLAAWIGTTKSSGSNGFLLLEDGFYLLLEDGFKLILEQSSAGATPWTPLTKS